MSLGDYMNILAKTTSIDFWSNDFYAGLGIGLIIFASVLGFNLSMYAIVFSSKFNSYVMPGSKYNKGIFPFLILIDGGREL